MLIFEAVPSEREDSLNNIIDAAHKWGLPGIICPVCGNTWSNTGLDYPLVNLSEAPFEGDYRIPQAVPLDEYDFLKNRLVPFLPKGMFVLPGSEFGPLIGNASGKFADFAWLNPWTLLIDQRAYTQLKRKGINLPLKASHKLAFRQKNHHSLVELQIEPHSLLVPDSNSSPCPACQYSPLSLPEEIVIDESSVSAQVDLFRVRNFTTLILASENFNTATVELGLTGIDFRKVTVTRVDRRAV